MSATAEAAPPENAAPQTRDIFSRIMVQGELFTDVPQDLYIPPDALEVFLETFEGPLDLLLYLIKRQNLNILDIPVAKITAQYMEYLALMEDMRFELAAEYLVMAAMLAEIKSRMLLPRPAGAEDDEHDPRAELVRRLQEYERYKKVAEDVDAIPRVGREIHMASAQMAEFQVEVEPPPVELDELLEVLREVLKRADMFDSHHVQREVLSVRERMGQVLQSLNKTSFTPLSGLFKAEEGRLGLLVTFLAVLELVREKLLDLVQSEAYAPVHVRLREADIGESLINS